MFGCISDFTESLIKFKPLCYTKADHQTIASMENDDRVEKQNDSDGDVGKSSGAATATPNLTESVDSTGQDLRPSQGNSGSASQQECSEESGTSFRKYESNFKKRNYRSQSNSMDALDDENDAPNMPVQRSNQESCSSESVEFQNDNGGRLAESSDERSEFAEGHADSNDCTTASEDDTDRIPNVLLKEPSKSDWSVVKDIFSRQIGSNYYIQNRFYGSLHAVQRLELMYKLEEHVGCVNALGFNEKGNLLASASDDLTVTIWDWATGRKHLVLQSGHRSNVFQSKWLPLDTECFVVSCARDGQVRLIDIRTSFTRKLAHHRSACHKITTHLDLPHGVLSAGEDSKVFSIDVRESKPTKLLSFKENEAEIDLYSIHSNPLNSFEFCVAGRSRFVKIYDRRKTTTPLHEMCPKHLLTEDHVTLTCAMYNHNGTEIVGSYSNEDIYLFDAAASYKTGDFAHKYQGHRNSATIKGVNFFGPQSEFVLSGSDCGNIFIWDKKTEAIVQWMAGDEQGIVNALEPHPHIPILATSGLDYDVKIWIPSNEKTPNIRQQSSFQKCIKKNLEAKARNNEEAESAFAGHVLWIVLRQARQAERRRQLARRRNMNLDDNETDDTDTMDEDDNDDENFNDDQNLSSSSSSTNDNSSDSDHNSES